MIIHGGRAVLIAYMFPGGYRGLCTGKAAPARAAAAGGPGCALHRALARAEPWAAKLPARSPTHATTAVQLELECEANLHPTQKLKAISASPTIRRFLIQYFAL